MTSARSRKRPRSTNDTARRGAVGKPRWLWPAVGFAAVAVAALAVAIVATRVGDDTPSLRAGSQAGPGKGADRELSQIRTNDFHSMAMSPTDRNLILYGHHGGVLRSTDGGRTWNKTNLTGETDDVMGMGVSGIEPNLVYAAGHDTFFKSIDTGKTWTKMKPELPGTDIHGMSVATDNPRRLYANVGRFGFFRSEDGGATWVKANTQPFQGDVIQVSASRANVVFVASVGSGVLRSDDAGANFRPTGKLRGAVLAVAVHATDSSVVYAGTESGFWASGDGGATWTERTPPDGGQAMVTAVSPIDPRDVVVVMIRDDRVGHVFRSGDGGVTWTTAQP